MEVAWASLGIGSLWARMGPPLPLPGSALAKIQLLGVEENMWVHSGQDFIKSPDPEALRLARSEISQLWRLTQPHALPCRPLEALLPGPFIGMICLYLFLIFTPHLGEVK